MEQIARLEAFLPHSPIVIPCGVPLIREYSLQCLISFLIQEIEVDEQRPFILLEVEELGSC